MNIEKRTEFSVRFLLIDFYLNHKRDKIFFNTLLIFKFKSCTKRRSLKLYENLRFS